MCWCFAGGYIKLREGEPRPLRRRSHPKDMIPVHLEAGRIVADHGLSVIDNVSEQVFVNQSESVDGHLVLGFKGRHEHPTHMEDIILGQVRGNLILSLISVTSARGQC